tara:strand:+ start:1555 stop:2070 length:516 start_codon:yes stop_codon:yes gene_type:complete
MNHESVSAPQHLFLYEFLISSLARFFLSFWLMQDGSSRPTGSGSLRIAGGMRYKFRVRYLNGGSPLRKDIDQDILFFSLSTIFFVISSPIADFPEYDPTAAAVGLSRIPTPLPSDPAGVCRALDNHYLYISRIHVYYLGSIGCGLYEVSVNVREQVVVEETRVIVALIAFE